MKRLIIILSFVLLSGCTVKYDIQYFDDTIKENFIVSTNTSKYCGNDLCMNYINQYAVNNISTNYYSDSVSSEYLYNKNIINSNGMYELQLNYEYFDTVQYTNSFLVRNLFKNIIITEDRLFAYDINNIFSNYLYLDEIVISFTTDKVISNNNSDEVIDGKYYWYIDKNNYQYKTIDVYFDKEKTESKNKELIEDGYVTWNFIKYVLYFLIFIGILVGIYFFKRFKKSSR